MITIKNPTCIIGIGGSGYLITSHMKSLIRKEYGELPDCIKFLCIDFDRAENNKKQYKKLFNEDSTLNAHADESAEWIRISSGRDINYERSIREAQPNADLRYFETDPGKKDNLLNLIGGFDLSEGAGQKRILGKFGIAYYTNYERILDKIKQVIFPLETEMVSGQENSDTISILLVNSFAGGAGAGMFLEVLFMISQLEINKKVEIITFNILPDVFLKNYGGNIFKELVEPNAYAAVTELEYIYNYLYEFKPTNHRRVLMTRDFLPKANFIINNQVYNGATVDFKSMIYSTANTMINLVLAGNGLNSQWSNFQQNMAGSVKGKNRTFCSLGYAEIIFDMERLKQYTIASILSKALRHYNGLSGADNCTNIKESLKVYIDDPARYLLHEDVWDSLAKVEEKCQVYATKKTFKDLISKIEEKKSDFEKEVNTTIERKQKDEVILDKVKDFLNKISTSTFDQSEINEKLNELIKELKGAKIDIEKDTQWSDEWEEYQHKYTRTLSEIIQVPKKYKRFWGGIKSTFFKDYLPQKIKSIERLIKNSKELLLKKQIYIIYNKQIDSAIEYIKDNKIENTHYSKLRWINQNKNIPELRKNDHNVILLESYFKTFVDKKIEEDRNINKDIIEKYLSSDEPFEHVAQQTLAMQLLSELDAENVSQLKNRLSQDQVQEVLRKVNELMHPLWNRENEHIIGNGSSSTGKLIRFKRVEAPANKEGTIEDFWGKDHFVIKEGDIIPSRNRHRQNFINLELGLPAFQIKSMNKYKNTFEDVLEKEGNKDVSVQYFAYNEIRQKVLNDEVGIFIFQDENEVANFNRAIDCWAFGWASGIIFKNQRRIKIHVSDKFKPDSKEDISKVENGVYDAFKDFGQTADLLKIFNAFKKNQVLLSDIEAQLNIKKGNAREYLQVIAESFAPTSPEEQMQKFRTNKKPYAQLSDEEKQLINKEESALKIGCEEFASEKKVNINFYPEFDETTRHSYFRLKLL